MRRKSLRERLGFSSKNWGRVLVMFGVMWVTPDALLIVLVQCDGLTLLFWRQLLSGISLSGVCVVLFKVQALKNTFRTAWKEVLALSLIWSVSTSGFALGVTLAPAASVLVIVSANPLVSALLSWIILRERLDNPTLAALLCGSVAVALVFAWDISSGVWLGYFLASLCALLLPLYMVCVRHISQHRPGVVMLPAVTIAGLLWVPLFTLAVGASPFSPSSHDWIFLILQGLVLCPGAYTIFTLGPAMIPAAEVALIMLLETVLGPVWVWLAVGQVPPRGTALGGALLLATLTAHSVWALQRDKGKKGGEENSVVEINDICGNSGYGQQESVLEGDGDNNRQDEMSGSSDVRDRFISGGCEREATADDARMIFIPRAIDSDWVGDVQTEGEDQEGVALSSQRNDAKEEQRSLLREATAMA